MARFGLAVAAVFAAMLMSCGARAAPPEPGSLLAARAGFSTRHVKTDYKADGPAAVPPPEVFRIVRYRSPVGDLAAYLTPEPGDGQRRPAVLWAHGGFGGIGEFLWDRASGAEHIGPLLDAGFVVMCPAWRGENDNPGQFEMFYGEVDDALAAVDHLARLPYVDPNRIYMAGHSTGGTMALLAAESTSRLRAVFSFGGAPDVESVVEDGDYGGQILPFPGKRPREAELRSPIRFVSAIRSPTFYFEGARAPAYAPAALEMAKLAGERRVPFSAAIIEGGDHFTILQPLLSLVARKIAADTGPSTNLSISPDEAREAFIASRRPVFFRYAPNGLEITLKGETAEACVILPAGDDAGCEGLDSAAVRAKLDGSPPRPFSAAVLRFEDWSIL
jgi:dienelactone hydrolase